jgi:hypothetical protein
MQIAKSGVSRVPGLPAKLISAPEASIRSCHVLTVTVRGGSRVGIKWAQRFVKRTPALEVKLGRTYECQRKLSKDSEVIRGWFTLVKNTVDKYGILPEDIYNFNKTSFQIGQISAYKVVTATDRLGRLKQVKPTNTE